MNSIKELISEVLGKYVTLKNYPDSGWLVEVPKDRSMADYASNMAFTLAKTLKKSPHKIAEEIVLDLVILFEETTMNGTKIIALNGFINFTLPSSFCFKYINQENFSKNAFCGSIFNN